jgi:potassium-transporting ATPase KdpC subunit
MIQDLRPALVTLVLMSLVTGVAYPLLVTSVAQAVFPEQASGSLLRRDGQVIGSRLIAQPSADPRYLWPRPSATGPAPWNAASSSGSNLGPTSSSLADQFAERASALRGAHGQFDGALPVDMITASASGLDPHISPAAARLQIPRVARARALDPGVVAALVEARVEPRTWGVLGEPRVNVLETNLALDALSP